LRAASTITLEELCGEARVRIEAAQRAKYTREMLEKAMADLTHASSGTWPTDKDFTARKNAAGAYEF
jgi:hypothetical protein